jgi:hypothetical protein
MTWRKGISRRTTTFIGEENVIHVVDRDSHETEEEQLPNMVSDSSSRVSESTSSLASSNSDNLPPTYDDLVMHVKCIHEHCSLMIHILTYLHLI